MTIQLVVGLQNPGEKYANTRHNAGAWFVHAIARRLNLTFKQEKNFLATWRPSVWVAKTSNSCCRIRI